MVWFGNVKVESLVWFGPILREKKFPDILLGVNRLISVYR